MNPDDCYLRHIIYIIPRIGTPNELEFIGVE